MKPPLILATVSRLQPFSRPRLGLAQSPRLQSHRFPIARLAQRILRSGDEVFKIERSQGAAGLVEFGFAPGGFDFAPLGVFAVVAGDELRGGGDRGIAGAAGLILAELRLQVGEQEIFAAIHGGIGVADLLAVDEGGLDEVTLRAGDAGVEDVVIGAQRVGVPNAQEGVLHLRRDAVADEVVMEVQQHIGRVHVRGEGAEEVVVKDAVTHGEVGTTCGTNRLAHAADEDVVLDEQVRGFIRRDERADVALQLATIVKAAADDVMRAAGDADDRPQLRREAEMPEAQAVEDDVMLVREDEGGRAEAVAAVHPHLLAGRGGKGDRRTGIAAAADAHGFLIHTGVNEHRVARTRGIGGGGDRGEIAGHMQRACR